MAMWTPLGSADTAPIATPTLNTASLDLKRAGSIAPVKTMHLSLIALNFCAVSIIVSVPVVLLFLFLQKYLVSGLTAGGVKG